MNEKEVKTIDARGLSCPQPVLLTKKALTEGTSKGNGEVFKLIVNSPTAKDNVAKYVKSQGFSVDIEEDEDAYILNMSR